MIPALGGIPGLPGLGIQSEAAGAATKTAAGQGAGSVFGNLLDNTVSTLKGAESLSVQALQGDADTRKVVDAVMNAEQSLQTAIAIRDKIVAAYLDVSRMSI